MLTAVKTAGQGDVGGGGSAAGTTADAAFSARQNEVLEVALKLLVEGGDKALTTAALARAANCSKESLYKWFGDRDGLLAAIVTHQASRVRIIDVQGVAVNDVVTLTRGQAFGEDL